MATFPVISLRPSQKYNPQVVTLQKFLISEGFLTPSQVGNGWGYYGPKTTAAVKAWQKANKVDNSTGPGYWGPRSIYAAKMKYQSKQQAPNNQKQYRKQNTTQKTTNTQPKNTSTKTTNNKSTGSNKILFQGPFGKVYKGAKVSYTGDKVIWRNPNGSAVWMSSDIYRYPKYITYIKNYASEVWPQVERDSRKKLNQNKQQQQQKQNTQPKANTTQNVESDFPTQNLSPSQTYNPEVVKLQKYLIKEGFLDESSIGNGWGYYGPKTTEAVKAWQEANGVDNSTGSGYWGPRSILVAKTKAQSAQNTGTQTQNTTQQNQQNQQQTTQTGTETQTGQTNQDVQSTAQSGTGGTPYFMGNYALVRFEGTGPRGTMSDNTVWLIDTSTKTIRPFMNADSLNNFFDEPVDINSIQVIPASELMPGGLLGPRNGEHGFELLGSEYAIKPDGTAKSLPYSSSQLATRYGHGISQDLEEESWMLLDGMLSQFEKAGIPPSEINKIRKDETQLAFYINALAYGGYSIPDVYRDIKARLTGSPVRPISATVPKSEYKKMDEYQRALSDQSISPPDKIGSLDTSSLQDLAVYNLPEEAFKTLIPIMDYNSPEFKAEMDKVQTSYYDILETQLNAKTEQEKAIADYKWNLFKDAIEKKYGVALENNAIDAWNQIEGLYNTFMNKRNIANSGLQQEAIDDYLRMVRRGDQLMRDEKMNKKDAEEMNYYLNYASPQQIKQLVETNPEKAKKWGLVPSAETKAKLSLPELKKKYPDAKEEDLLLYISSILDENGNYRSNLYQKRLGNMLDLAQPNLSTELGIKASRDEFKRNEALRKSLLKEEQAYKEFTVPDVPFLRDVSAQNKKQEKYLSGGKNGTESFANRIKQANLKFNPNSVNVSKTVSPASSSATNNNATGYNNLSNLVSSLKTSTPSYVPNNQTASTGNRFNVSGSAMNYTPGSLSQTIEKATKPDVTQPVKTISQNNITPYTQNQNRFTPTSPVPNSFVNLNQQNTKTTTAPYMNTTQQKNKKTSLLSPLKKLWGKVKSWF